MPNERPRLILPFTILTAAGMVRLVAGEEFRYTLEAPGIENWLPQALAKLDGRHTVDEVLEGFDVSRRSAALTMIKRLYSERVLEDAPAVCAHPLERFSIAAEGTGRLFERFINPSNDKRKLHVLCQDRLDYFAALEFNRKRLKGAEPWMWVTSGPIARAYVSPVFLPDCGPCMECVIGRFQKLSPAAEIYDHLSTHAEQGHEILPAEISESALRVLEGLVLWKAEQLAPTLAPSALYQLHVLELATMTVTAHDVARDPECRACCQGQSGRVL